METGKEVSGSPTSDIPLAFALSPDGFHVVIRRKSRISLWNIRTGKEPQIYSGHQDAVGLAFSPDGKYFVSGSGADPTEVGNDPWTIRCTCRERGQQPGIPAG